MPGTRGRMGSGKRMRSGQGTPRGQASMGCQSHGTCHPSSPHSPTNTAAWFLSLFQAWGQGGQRLTPRPPHGLPPGAVGGGAGLQRGLPGPPGPGGRQSRLRQALGVPRPSFSGSGDQPVWPGLAVTSVPGRPLVGPHSPLRSSRSRSDRLLQTAPTAKCGRNRSYPRARLSARPGVCGGGSGRCGFSCVARPLRHPDCCWCKQNAGGFVKSIISHFASARSSPVISSAPCDTCSAARAVLAVTCAGPHAGSTWRGKDARARGALPSGRHGGDPGSATLPPGARGGAGVGPAGQRTALSRGGDRAGRWLPQGSSARRAILQGLSLTPVVGRPRGPAQGLGGVTPAAPLPEPALWGTEGALSASGLL